jgi:tRNA (cytidine/uridine-2'-O-)-methyltransferase
MRLALYQPDIPQNAGTMLRLGACLGVSVDVIEPCGFIWDDKRLRRAGMDYLDQVDLVRYRSWQHFLETRAPGRLVLLTTQGAIRHDTASFAATDTLLLGRESAGVPLDVHQSADLRVRIPLTPVARSLNVAVAAAIVLGEALRQTDQYPEDLAAP